MARAESRLGVLQVEVVYCATPGAVDTVALSVAVGTTLAQALGQSGLLQRHGLGNADLKAGIWGRLRSSDTVLRDRDRVEIYRPLQVDPKEARRQRYKKHRESRQV
jgi:uncharacterized protein